MREPAQPGPQVPVASTPPPPYPGQRRADQTQPQTGVSVSGPARGDPPTYANIPTGAAQSETPGRTGLLPYQVTPPKSQVRSPKSQVRGGSH